MKVEGNHVKIVPAPVILLVFIALGFAMNWILPLPILTNLLVAHVVGLLIVGVGSLVGGIAVVEMRRLHTSPNPHKPVTTLVEAGVFRYSRNPVYLAMFVMYIGIAICVNVLWLILLFPALLWSVKNWVVKLEEDYLERRFNDVYRQYKKRVRRWV
jgi:protein-S-isoprenylcysteine O-methyltransferase Ste14